MTIRDRILDFKDEISHHFVAEMQFPWTRAKLEFVSNYKIIVRLKGTIWVPNTDVLMKTLVVVLRAPDVLMQELKMLVVEDSIDLISLVNENASLPTKMSRKGRIFLQLVGFFLRYSKGVFGTPRRRLRD